MQHLRENYLYGVSDTAVAYVTNDTFSAPRSLEEFHSFPKTKGWVVDPVDYRIDINSENGPSNPKKMSFVQAWLFFGLILTIVQKDGQPMIEYQELVTKDGYNVTTECLTERLQQWAEWEENNPVGRKLRMVRVENVLDLAKRVVRADLAGDVEPLGYSVRVDHNPLYIPDEVILSIMTVGELIRRFKDTILRKTQSTMRGWCSDDESGWGTPRYVLVEMKRKMWCPRTIYLLRKQLRSNATLLLAAYKVHSSEAAKMTNPQHGPEHLDKGCTEYECKVTPEDDSGQYRSNHSPGFCDAEDTGGVCEEFVGPNDEDVRSLLRQNKSGDSGPERFTPLVRFVGSEDDSPRLEVVKWESKMTYATISHVWSDGYGNPHKNKLRVCQLRFINHQLEELGKDLSHDRGYSGSMPFWMDTMLIPVGATSEVKDLKRKAIAQIPSIFRNSTYTIVLDYVLTTMNHTAKPAETAMRILASNWTRRLWTLQEAYLSKSLHVAGNPKNIGANVRSVKSLETVFQELLDATGLKTAQVEEVNQQLQQNVMSEERKQRLRRSKQGPDANEIATPAGGQAAALITSTWKAVRWRTTSNPFHETLALATLLELPIDDAILDAGVASTSKGKATLNDRQEKDQLMKAFWTIFNKKWPGSIPPGIIFLPPPRVEELGFGWAPRTWLSGHELDHPDPFSFTGVDSAAELHATEGRSSGLRVRYPGFLLHVENRAAILSTNLQAKKQFWFPVGLQLQEWYKVETADEESTRRFPLPELLRDERSLAIILSRPRPSESDAEIGLLVQVREQCVEHTQTLGTRKGDAEEMNAFYCDIIHRVKVSRDTMSPIAPGLIRSDAFQTRAAREDPASQEDTGGRFRIMVPSDKDDDICLGEVLDSDQIWYVDSFSKERLQGSLGGTPNNGTMTPKSRKGFREFVRRKIPREPTPDSRGMSGQAGPGPLKGAVKSAKTFREDRESVSPKLRLRDRAKTFISSKHPK